MKKVKVTVELPADLVKWAEEHELNLSLFLTMKLEELRDRMRRAFGSDIRSAEVIP
jgi:hypothetical protein